MPSPWDLPNTVGILEYQYPLKESEPSLKNDEDPADNY
jgi:hypothetical protein